VWLVALFAVHRAWPRLDLPLATSSKSWWMLAFGAVLAALAVFPYIAVGLTPTTHGWMSRHTLLLGLPVGIILVAGMQILFRTRKRSIGVVGGAILVSILLGFVLDSAYSYIQWQARWIKDTSVMATLASTPDAGNYSVYWIDDNYVLGGEPTYRFYEWSAMLRQTYGGESRIGLDRRTTKESFLFDGQPYFTHLYYLGDFDPRGCEAIVTISQGSEHHSDIGLVARYLYYSLVSPSERDRMMHRVTRVTVEPYASPYATNCRAVS